MRAKLQKIAMALFFLPLSLPLPEKHIENINQICILTGLKQTGAKSWFGFPFEIKFPKENVRGLEERREARKRRGGRKARGGGRASGEREVSH